MLYNSHAEAINNVKLNMTIQNVMDLVEYKLKHVACSVRKLISICLQVDSSLNARSDVELDPIVEKVIFSY